LRLRLKLSGRPDKSKGSGIAPGALLPHVRRRLTETQIVPGTFRGKDHTAISFDHEVSHFKNPHSMLVAAGRELTMEEATRLLAAEMVERSSTEPVAMDEDFHIEVIREERSGSQGPHTAFGPKGH
jgi:hypothetical protein